MDCAIVDLMFKHRNCVDMIADIRRTLPDLVAEPSHLQPGLGRALSLSSELDSYVLSS